MSKVLKFIVHLVVICTLVCVLGLVLPPFFGGRTVIVDKADEATNLPVGSVTYAIPEKSSAISVGTPILVQKDSKTYKYTITDLDTSKGTGTVTDQSVSGGKTLTIKVGDYVPKVVITIGYVGYLLVATESIEGLIILGLVVLFLIILYVIAELWKKEPEDEYEDLQGDTRHVKSARELKAEEKARAKRMKQEDKEPEKIIYKWMKLYPDLIFVCDEVGNGIVPLDPFEREYRDRLGRLLCEIAGESVHMERVICGIGQRIK